MSSASLFTFLICLRRPSSVRNPVTTAGLWVVNAALHDEQDP